MVVTVLGIIPIADCQEQVSPENSVDVPQCKHEFNSLVML